MEILEEQIKAQGELVRKLKAAKEDKDRVGFIPHCTIFHSSLLIEI